MQTREVAVDDPIARELLDEYLAMRAAGFPGTYRPTSPAPAQFVPPAGVFLVAMESGAPIGCGGVRRLASGAGGTRFELKHLYLRPAARGVGHGRALLTALEEEARGLGATELVLDTHHTLDAAGRLYTRAGYSLVEPYNDNPNATRWYAKALV